MRFAVVSLVCFEKKNLLRSLSVSLSFFLASSYLSEEENNGESDLGVCVLCSSSQIIRWFCLFDCFLSFFSLRFLNYI